VSGLKGRKFGEVEGAKRLDIFVFTPSKSEKINGTSINPLPNANTGRNNGTTPKRMDQRGQVKRTRRAEGGTMNDKNGNK
jgi:hypothetical protein